MARDIGPRDADSVSISLAKQRNATRSRNGNTTLSFLCHQTDPIIATHFLNVIVVAVVVVVALLLLLLLGVKFLMAKAPSFQIRSG